MAKPLLASTLYVVAVAAVASNAAYAQTDQVDATSSKAAEIPEIVITAEKRSTNLQRTPIAVTALNADQLDQERVSDLRELAAIVPGFKAGEIGGGFSQITIRGIGIQDFVPLGENAVAVNVNEVTVSRPTGVLTSTFDLAAIEVLRGPQGTLFGRNATAGAVNITSARPTDDLSGYARINVGNYGEIRAEAAVGGAIEPGLLAIRVAGFDESRRGYGRNLATGTEVDDKHAKGVRGTVVLTPAQALKFTLIGEYYYENDHDAAYHYFGDAGTIQGVSGTLGSPSFAIRDGGTAALNSYDVNNAADSHMRLQTSTITGIIEYSFDPFNVKSITGYRDQKFDVLSDIDGTSLLYGVFAGSEPAQQFSEELQLQFDTERLHVTTGLYFFRETDESLPADVAFSTGDIGIPGPNTLLNVVSAAGTVYTRDIAAFGQASYEIADGLSLIAGVRVGQDRKHLISNVAVDLVPFNPSAPLPPNQERGTAKFSSTTPKGGLQYQITPKTLIYATYAQGFKAGGFNAATLPSQFPLAPVYSPEKVTSYEVGLKTTFLDGKARANFASFYSDYSNLQVSQAGHFAIITSNAGKARIYGLESEFTVYPVENLEIGLNASYLHATYTDYFGTDDARPLYLTPPTAANPTGGVDFAGKFLNNAPEWSGALSAQYTIPVAGNEFVLRGEGEFSSRFYFSPGNYSIAGQSGYAKANASLIYRIKSSRIDVMTYVRNITDKQTRTSAQIESIDLGLPVQGSLAPPRTFGIEASYRF